MPVLTRPRSWIEAEYYLDMEPDGYLLANREQIGAMKGLSSRKLNAFIATLGSPVRMVRVIELHEVKTHTSTKRRKD